ncbi:MFS transporter [Streptomyces sp. NPDC026672]|uniref:MFS transporter n=1 Tax=unclassified Streptomyces TaxID=2593676 RepID=UPI00340FDF1A
MSDTQTRSTPLPARVWILTAAVTAVGAQALVPGVLLADIARGTGIGVAAAGTVFGLYGLALAASSLAAGARLGGLAPRTRVTGGLAALAAALLLVASATTGPLLLLGVLVAGAAAGVALPAVYLLVPALVDRDTAPRATSRVLLGWALAFVIGIPVAGAVAEGTSWRGAFVVLAALTLASAVCGRALPASRTPEAARPRFREALDDRNLVRLLAGVVAFMAAFYGVFAFVGTDARLRLHQGPGLSSAIALAFGCGFALAGAVQRWTARFDRSLLPPAFACLVGIYALLPYADRTLPTVLAVAALWGFVNETALTLLVVRVSHGPGASTALALYNCVTYVAAAVGTACAGAVLSGAGFPALGLCAAAVCGLGLAAVLGTSRPSTT